MQSIDTNKFQPGTLTGRLDFGAKDAVVDLLKGGETVPVESVKGASRALENKETLDATNELGNTNLVADALGDSADGAFLLTVANKAMLVGTTILVVKHDAGPLVLDEIDLDALNVGVIAEEVAEYVESVLLGAENILRSEHLGKVVERVLDSVSGDYRRVVRLGVRGLERGTREKAASSVLGNLVARGVLGVANDSEESDEILAVRGLSELDGHS